MKYASYVNWVISMKYVVTYRNNLYLRYTMVAIGIICLDNAQKKISSKICTSNKKETIQKSVPKQENKKATFIKHVRKAKNEL